MERGKVYRWFRTKGGLTFLLTILVFTGGSFPGRKSVSLPVFRRLYPKCLGLFFSLTNIGVHLLSGV